MVCSQLAPQVRRKGGNRVEIAAPVVIERAVELAGAVEGLIRKEKFFYFLDFQPHKESHALSLAERRVESRGQFGAVSDTASHGRIEGEPQRRPHL